jgi:hypothetical protein
MGWLRSATRTSARRVTASRASVVYPLGISMVYAQQQSSQGWSEAYICTQPSHATKASAPAHQPAVF